MSRFTFLALFAFATFALTGCEFGNGDLEATPTTPAVEEDVAEDTADAPDLLDDEAVAELDTEVAAMFEPNASRDLEPGLLAAESFLRQTVQAELGDEALLELPDSLMDAWLARPEAGDSVDAEARTEEEEGPLCEPAAIIAGVWLDAGNDYYGLWFAPDAGVVGPMGGVTRGLATPGGSWGGGFGTFAHRLGPQGGLYFRDFDGTGTFGGMWSAPLSPYEGTMGGHWIRVSPWGGYYFGVMTVCPW